MSIYVKTIFIYDIYMVFTYDIVTILCTIFDVFLIYLLYKREFK